MTAVVLYSCTNRKHKINMNSVLIVACVVLGVALAAPSDDKYTDKYDSVNIKEILENDALLKAYFNCLMDTGKCTPDANELKAHLSSAISDRCSKCTEAQKEKSKETIKYLINNKADYWAELSKKYDPTGENSKKYEAELKEIKAH